MLTMVLLVAPLSAQAATLRTSNGITAHVAERALSAFRCIVGALERVGYPIRALGGYRRHGSVRRSLHPLGLALDINQLRRNVTRPRMPRNEAAMARHCGLISGASWHHGDSGHFQFGSYPKRSHQRHRRWRHRR